MFRHYYERCRNWLNSRQPRNRDSLIVGFVGSLLLALFAAGVGIVVSLVSGIDLNEELPIWTLAVGGSIAVVAGFVGGALISQGYYRPTVEKAELAVELEREKRASLEPDTDALQRLGTYIDHFTLLLEDIASGKISVTGGFVDGVEGERAEETLCSMPCELMRAAGAIEVKSSLWIEREAPSVPLPGGSKLGLPQTIASTKLEAVRGPNHTTTEMKKFSVRLDKSWMRLAEQHQSDQETDEVLCIDDLSIAGLVGDDLDAFRATGYECVRVIRFLAENKLARLVFLCETAAAFSLVEDRYLQLLQGALNMAGRLQIPDDVPV